MPPCGAGAPVGALVHNSVPAPSLARNGVRGALTGDFEDHMDIKRQMLSLIDETLNLQGRTNSFNEGTRLLGALTELDSMGVVALLTAFESRLGFSVEDDEIDGQVFETVGTLLEFVKGKLETQG